MKAILGIKKEMTQVFQEDGTVVPVTLVDVNNVVVLNRKTEDQDGVNAIVLGKDENTKPNKPQKDQFKKSKIVPKYIKQVLDFDSELKIGDKVNPGIFSENELVDVIGVTKGKGFQGVVKKWGFHGGPKTHGQSDRHRAPGSIGSGTTPGRVYKGKKMAGRMGGQTQTTKNLKVIMVDKSNGLIAIKGALPGKKGSLVLIKTK